MAVRSKKGLKGSIDDVLGGLLEEDDPVPGKSTVKSPISGEATGRPRGIIPTASKRSLADDDFFRNLAQEAGGADGEESDVSDEDPVALLQTMKDIDDMDADLFGLKKPRSAPSGTSTKDSGLDGSRGDPSKSGKPFVVGKESAPVNEKKPLSAPADPSRQYRKFSFDELDDPLAGLLSDEEDAAAKKNPMLQSKAASEIMPRAAMKETSATSPARPIPGTRKREELTFEDDSDDLIDALGFGDSPVIQRKEKRRDSETPRPARSKLDDLLGRGTSAKLLERPPTGERKEFKLDPKYQKTPDKDDLWAEEDFVFGSYQPTMSSTPEGRQSRRQSVRFSSENIDEVKADQKSKPTTPATASPARGGRNGSDWLGLKDEVPDSPLKDTTAVAKAKPTSPAKKPVSASQPPSGAKITEDKISKPGLLEPDLTQAEDDNWLVNALSRKKALQQEKVPMEAKGSVNVDHRTQEERSDVRPETGKVLTATVTHREPTIVPAASEVKSNRSPGTKPSVPRGTTPEVTTVPTGMKKDEQLHAASSQWDTAVSRQAENSQAHPMRADIVSSSVYEKPLLTNQQTGHFSEGVVTQTQVIDLMSKIQKLELEREQQKMLLESLQIRHREDLELIENAHRNRLKVLEQTFQQREERLQQENQELSVQYMFRCQSAEQEKSQLLAQHQRKLDEFEKEKAKETERLRELQRVSIQDMRKDHEEQLLRLKRLKDQEIDAVTSASSHTRSLNGVIEQMEGFSSKLNDLSYKVESTHQNTSHELEIGARQRDEQLRVLQERLTRQQRDMEEERGRLHEVITKMESRLNEQTRLLEQERWRVNAEQSKVDSLQRSLEEQRRIMNQQLSMEREELERAKSALLEEQQTVMHRCAEERRKLAVEWSDFHTQQKLVHERAERDVNRVLQIDTQREGAIMSIAKEQAQLKIQASELRLKQEQLSVTMETLEQEQEDLKQEKERINSTALRVRQRAEEIDSMSKLASQKYQEGEKALHEAQRVESEHQGRLRTIHQQMERLRQQEQHLHQERMNMAQQRRQLDQLRLSLPSNPPLMPMMGTQSVNLPNIHEFSHSIIGPVQMSHSAPDVTSLQPSEFHAKMALLKYSAARDRDFLEDEQHFLASLKTSVDFSTSQTV